MEENYLFKLDNATIKAIQTKVGAKADGAFGPLTAEAVKTKFA